MLRSIRPAGRASLCALLLTLSSPALVAQSGDPVVTEVIEIGRQEPRVQEHLIYLTERIGPRLTSSSSLQRACEWASARFAAYGLDARLERWGEFPVGFERGPWSGGMVAPIEIDYVFGTHSWTPGTPGPVRARAVLYPESVESLDKEALAGAWVVDLPRKLRPRARVRREIDAVLEELGVAGRVRGAGDLVFTGGNQDVDFEDLPTEVRINLQRPFYEDLMARLERGEAVELEFDVDNRFFPGPVPQYNVIADLIGSELPDEYVIVGGHIDTWDGADGVQDNGTGVATTIEAARLLVAAGARPRRTIRFMLWGGEEQGLLGSRAYVEAHPEEMERISAVLVHDKGSNYLSGISGPAPLIAQIEEAFAPILTLDSAMPFEIRENDGLSRRGGSDHVSFIQAGVPGFFWEQSGRADYDFIHHTQNDTLEYAVPEYQRHSAMVVALAAYGLANLDEKLDRTEMMAPERPSTRRRMGVYLDGVEVQGVAENGKAEAAGWQEGDVILSIDGAEVASQGEIVRELQKGGPEKVVRLRRGEELVESVLDYTGDPSEIARAKQEAERKAEEASAGTQSGG